MIGLAVVWCCTSSVQMQLVTVAEERGKQPQRSLTGRHFRSATCAYPVSAHRRGVFPSPIVLPVTSLRRDIPHWYNVLVIAATAYNKISVIFTSIMPVSKSRVYQLAQDWKGFDAIKHLVVLYVLFLFLTATIANTTCSLQWRFVQFSWLRLEISSSISGQTARRYISRAL